MNEVSKYTKEQVENAIKGTYGIVNNIAITLSVSRQTIYNYIKEYDLQNLIDDERAKIVDLAENKLVEKIEAGNETMIGLALKTLGKKRGYVEKQEVEANLNINNISDLVDKSTSNS